MLSAEQIKINPGHDFDHYAKILVDKGRVQIPDFFDAETVEKIYSLILGNTVWNLAYNEYDQFYESPKDDFDKAPPQIKNKFMQAIYKRAQAGFQYVFYQYYLTQAVNNSEEAGHPLHTLHHWANSNDFITILKKITGDEAISWCDVFVSRYDPGHFLSLHDDTHPKHNRSVAYTLGLTKDWNPNWGGHLVFLDKKGGIKEGFSPEFNTLTVFDNPQDHAVQIVTPSAAKARYSFLGWANR